MRSHLFFLASFKFWLFPVLSLHSRDEVQLLKFNYYVTDDGRIWSERTSKYLKQQKDKDGEHYNISGGFVEMLNNKATVLVEKVLA